MSVVVDWTEISPDDEEHELLICKDEIENNFPGLPQSQYLVQRACIKANQLGRERMKVKEVRWQSVIGGWAVQFLCERFL